MNVDLRLGDCLDVLPTLGPADAVVTDPPYSFASKGGGLYADHHHLDTIDDGFGTDFLPAEFLKAIVGMFGRNLLIWHSQKLLPSYLDFAANEGLKWDLMFWHKTNAMPNYGGKLMSDTEYCIRLFRAGESHVTRGLNYNTYRKYHIDTVQANNGHPTPKPLALMEKQILLFTEAGDTVLDPFMGSGTTALACIKHGRNFIGIERDPAYFAIAQRRIAAAQAQMVLPLFG